jgi:hypothetical protein
MCKYILLILSILLAALFSPPALTLLADGRILPGGVIALSATISGLGILLCGFCAYGIRHDRSLGFSIKSYAAYCVIPFVGALALYQIYDGIRTYNASRGSDREFDYFKFDGTHFVQTKHRVKINSEGWRSSLEYLPAESHQDLTFLIGDSFVFGFVDQEYTIDNILMNTYLDGKDIVYNFGRAGIGYKLYLEISEQYRHLNPDNVFLFSYVGNDFRNEFDGVYSAEHSVLRARIKAVINSIAFYKNVGEYLSRWQHFAKVNPQSMASFAERGIDFEVLSPFYVAGIYPDSNERGLSADLIANYAETFESTSYVQETVLKIRDYFPKSRFCLFLIPHHFQVSQRYVEIESQFHLPIEGVLGRELQDAVLNWAQDNSICVIDLLPAIQAYEKRTNELLFMPLDGHLNRKGNSLLADILHARFLGDE